MLPGHGLPDRQFSSLVLVALLASFSQHLSLKTACQGDHA